MKTIEIGTDREVRNGCRLRNQPIVVETVAGKRHSVGALVEHPIHTSVEVAKSVVEAQEICCAPFC